MFNPPTKWKLVPHSERHGHFVPEVKYRFWPFWITISIPKSPNFLTQFFSMTYTSFRDFTQEEVNETMDDWMNERNKPVVHRFNKGE